MIGMSLSGALCTYFVIRSDWQAVSDAVIASHDHGDGSGFDDLDWDDLPKHIQEAATTLGYTKSIWDNDGDSPLDDMDWEDLSTAQKQAAEVLNYNQEKWDK